MGAEYCMLVQISGRIHHVENDKLNTLSICILTIFQEFCQNIETPKPMWRTTQETTRKHVPVYQEKKTNRKTETNKVKQSQTKSNKEDKLKNRDKQCSILLRLKNRDVQYPSQLVPKKKETIRSKEKRLNKVFEPEVTKSLCEFLCQKLSMYK